MPHPPQFTNVSDENKQIIQQYADFRFHQQHRAKKTVTNDIKTLVRMCRYLNNIPIDDITKKDLQDFFSSVENLNTRDLYASIIIKFFNWRFNLERRERPPTMKWYDYQSAKDKRRRKDPNAKEKYFIDRKHYDTLILSSSDYQQKALFQTLYLTGARPSEIISMTFGDVQHQGNGFVVIVRKSKTEPRKIPLCEYPHHLLRWLDEHPLKGQNNAPLWIIKEYRGKEWVPMRYKDLRRLFYKALDSCNITKPFCLKCFRKTRATIMFNDRKFQDKDLAMFFGWSLEAIGHRRADYDLTGFDDLLQKIQGQSTLPPSYEQLEHEKQLLEQSFENRFRQMEQQFEERMKILDSGLAKAARKHMPDYPSQKIIKDYQRLKTGLELILQQLITEGRQPEEIKKFQQFMNKGLH